MYKKTPTIFKNGLNSHFLLYLKDSKTPIKNHKQLTGQLLQIRNRWDIPFSIRDIRHSYGTWFIRSVNENPKEVETLAYQMGTSAKMLMNVYYDAKVVQQLHMDHEHEFDHYPQREELNKIFEKDLNTFNKKKLFCSNPK